MIPKIIHFCWLSDDPYPDLIRMCINSWSKKMPDYEIRKWDMTNFDINSVRFVKEACDRKKWAFAADYIRLYALYYHGGIYLDSDVFVKKNFDAFLNNECFSSVEFIEKCYNESLSLGIIDKEGNVFSENICITGIAIQAAIIGSVKGNKYIHECMAHYEKEVFIMENGTELNTKYVLPNVMAFIAKNFGFKYCDKEQMLQGGVKIYPSVYFAGYPNMETKSAYAIHFCCGSWRTISFIIKIKQIIRKFLFIMQKGDK